MEYKDIKNQLPKPTQYICAEVSIQHRYHRNAGEKLQDEVKWWVKRIQEGSIVPDKDGKLPGVELFSLKCRGTKEECQRKAMDERFWHQTHGSTSRCVQLGYWSESWRVLPADEKGRWIPGKSLIEKALQSLTK